MVKRINNSVKPVTTTKFTVEFDPQGHVVNVRGQPHAKEMIRRYAEHNGFVVLKLDDFRVSFAVKGDEDAVSE